MSHNFWMGCLAIATWLPCTVAAQSAETATGEDKLCEPNGYTIGFFNGVGNTRTDANNGLAALRRTNGNRFEINGEPVNYELFYNQTGKKTSATIFQDLLETYQQRAEQVDDSGRLANRIDMAWEVISSNDAGALARLGAAIESVEAFRDRVNSEITDALVAGAATLSESPPTEQDVLEQKTNLRERILLGEKILLIGHSQGNLFLNAAVDNVTDEAERKALNVLHIAPASPSLKGEYVLADIDNVIRLLDVASPRPLPEPNIQMTLSGVDSTGHSLRLTYLDPARIALMRVESEIMSAIDGLKTPESEATEGFFTVTMTWDGTGDVDLHTFEPNGTHVFYQNKSGDSGVLDVDNTTAEGPEHYFASCDVDDIQTGTYDVAINNYRDATQRNVTVQLSSRNEVLTTQNLPAGPERGADGNNSPTEVFSVSVKRDNNGELQAKPQ